MSQISELLKLQTSWDYLKSTDKPIFIYGMGDGCLKLMREFSYRNIAVAGIFASDEFVRGHSFQGHLVRKLSDIENAIGCGNFVIALAFAAGYRSLMEQIDDIASRNILLAPDTDVIGTGAFTKEYLEENLDRAELVYSLLADDVSKQTYIDVLSFKLTGDIRYLKNCETSPDEAYRHILKPALDEIYVDCGAFRGDTVSELLSFTDGRYNKIYALEPDARSFRKLSEFTSGMDNVYLYNVAAWSENTELMFSSGGGRQSQISDNLKKSKPVLARSVDSILGGNPATYIKYDVEGAEKQAIAGSAETIKRFEPKLCVAIYHRACDMIDIPLSVHDLCKGYKLYIRHYPYYPAWETNLFSVKE